MTNDSIAQMVSEIWDSVSNFIPAVDIKNVSDSFISVIVDSYEVEPENLRPYFSDFNILQSLSNYLPDLDSDEDECEIEDDYGDYDYED
jgi:hypothetical protein